MTTVGYRSNPDRVVNTMAHEGGHYLGLFHTTEAEATLFDPLDAPPAASCPTTRNGFILRRNPAVR